MAGNQEEHEHMKYGVEMTPYPVVHEAGSLKFLFSSLLASAIKIASGFPSFVVVVENSNCRDCVAVAHIIAEEDITVVTIDQPDQPPRDPKVHTCVCLSACVFEAVFDKPYRCACFMPC